MRKRQSYEVIPMNTQDSINSPPQKNLIHWIFGLGSFIWLLLRSGTNPRRLAYPCQRAALLSSVGFGGYLVSLLGGTHLYHRLKHKAEPNRVGFFVLALLAIPILTGSSAPVKNIFASPTLPAWTSPSAVSDVFAVSNVHVPQCSLDGGTLPGTSPCNDPQYSLHDEGVDRLVNLMESKGTYFYQTTSHPDGIVGVNDVVVIKINNQWGASGYGDGVGRQSTNNDVLKGLIWRILQHPDNFSGEVVVVENTQGVDWRDKPANAEDPDQSYQDVLDVFDSLGYSVSFYNWTDLNYNLISGGSIGSEEYPTGEYSEGNMSDAYILLEDTAATGTNELSYPKFQTANGTYVSMRYGVWDESSSYDSDRLTFINLPVLKVHGMAGATIAWKNLVGFVTIENHDERFGSWNAMHDFFWGYTTNSSYGLLGQEMALIRAPDLHLVDAIWVSYEGNTGGNAIRQNVLLASTDPFAVDWYASEYVLRPLADGDQDTSAARAGTFRSATRTNQNAAYSKWPDGNGKYPYIDLLDSFNGDTPTDGEKNQMNVYISGYPTTVTPRIYLPIVVLGV